MIWNVYETDYSPVATHTEKTALQNTVLDNIQSSDDFCLQTFYALVQQPCNSWLGEMVSYLKV